MEQIEATITGRVQLVMYRDFAQRKARHLGLTGFVRNNDDGSVTVVARGSKEKLIIYIEELKKGSMFSRVDSVVVSWQQFAGEYDGFMIRY